MILRKQKYIIILSALFILFQTHAKADHASGLSFQVLKSLDLQDSAIKSLRKDVRDSIIIIKKGEDPAGLPELKFYRYKLKNGDNFWKILSKTSLNIDTLSTINSLSSPGEVFPGKEIYLSNIRGIVYKINNNDTLEDISKKYSIPKKYLCKINKIPDDKIEKGFLFIPSGEISNIEKSLFLGVGFANPLKNSRRTSCFGRRIDPFNKRLEFHTGIDLACPVGSNVFASRKGRVVFTGYMGGYGLLLILKHEYGYSTYYGHLKKILIQEGDLVERGEKIAISGESGRCTGPHLHFEVRKETKPINPGILL